MTKMLVLTVVLGIVSIPVDCHTDAQGRGVQCDLLRTIELPNSYISAACFRANSHLAVATVGSSESKNSQGVMKRCVSCFVLFCPFAARHT